MITIDIINKYLTYQPETGLFLRNLNTRWTKVDDVAGTRSEKGYILISIKSKTYRAHRLAWFLTFGFWPNQIDHINGKKDDNRIVNLRDVDNEENHKNMKANSSNTSGRTGVWLDNRNGTWVAEIRHNKKKVYLGAFINKIDAFAARDKAELKYNYHKNHGRVE